MCGELRSVLGRQNRATVVDPALKTMTERLIQQMRKWQTEKESFKKQERGVVVFRKGFLLRV